MKAIIKYMIYGTMFLFCIIGMLWGGEWLWNTFTSRSVLASLGFAALAMAMTIMVIIIGFLIVAIVEATFGNGKGFMVSVRIEVDNVINP